MFSSKEVKVKPVRCNFKNVTDEDKAKFKDSSCLLTISVGQESHEDKRFIATIDLIRKAFKSVTIALHDTLQRHTIAIDWQGDARYFYGTALALGDRWIERNQKYYNEFINRVTITRWDEWLNSPEFDDKKNLIFSEINRDKRYRALFDRSINEYLTRYGRRMENLALFNRKHAENLCFDYLVEECAVLCLWPNTGCQFEIYAGNHNDAMNETRKRFVHTNFPDSVRSVTIGFNHRPDLKPQNFKLAKLKESVILSEDV